MATENLIDKLSAHFKQKLPFVVYRKPVEPGREAQSTVQALLQHNHEQYLVKDYSESGFVLAPFDSRRDAILIPSSHSDAVKISTAAFLGAARNQFTTASHKKRKPIFPSTASRGDEKEKAKKVHLDLLAKGIEALQGGNMDKVVLSRREEVSISRSALELFSDLLETYQSAFVYCWYHPNVGIWLGATPESLVHLRGNEYRTMAFASTQLYKGSMLVDWGNKELQEQQYVTDSILANLQQLGLKPEIQSFTGEERVGTNGTYTSRAGNLLHLRTDIRGKVKNQAALEQIVKALHPTPAVGGLPKETARNFILEQEPYDREFYTGFLGELNLQENRPRARNRRNVENLAYGTLRKQSSLYVNLRCMKLEDQRAIIYVGGGITADSDPEAEWEETVNKSQTMKQVLH